MNTVFTPIDHRGDPRLVPPYLQLPPTHDGCQECTIATSLQWIHQFGKWEPGRFYGHSRAFLSRLAAEFIRKPGNRYMDIVDGVMEVGTTPEWKYPTCKENGNHKPLPDAVRQGAIKVLTAISQVLDPTILPGYLQEGNLIDVRLPWYEQFKDPGSDGIVRSLPSSGGTYHFVNFVGLVPKGRRKELHYVFDPHRGTDYGDHGYGYVNKRWFEQIADKCLFYVLH